MNCPSIVLRTEKEVQFARRDGMLSLGIDSGSTMTKGVLFDGKEIVLSRMMPTSMNPQKVIYELYHQMYSQDIKVVVTTGYGRQLLSEADFNITEITCHAAGAFFLNPQCDSVIDIGGQDCKAMILNEEGKVIDFLMNDKCAAGTGRFLEMIMSRAERKMNELDSFVEGCSPVTINSMCAVFAESEMIGLLAQGENPGNIVLGCVDSVCKRTAIFAQKLAPMKKVFFSGGLAQSQIMRTKLKQYLNAVEVTTDPQCQYVGAFGAAILGYQRYVYK